MERAVLLLDLGHGAFARLASEIEPSTLSAVAISHLHPDHFVDLVALRHYLRFERPGDRVAVLGPAALADRLDGLLGEPGFTASALDHAALAEGPLMVGPFTLEVALVTHADESYAFRVSSSDGPGLVYSGDCGRATDLDRLIRPGDTLLCEVSFGPGPVPPGAQHLDGHAVGDLAARTDVGALLLTHLQMGFSPADTLETVRKRYAGPAELVAPGDRRSI